ncbi:hypothetical protein V1478_000130 [Vespula squamosa]|uniref:Uncharacterized protein n=1 Tax=Vespula squamosa TaxID=30214 RepID=A0ABD2ARH8_VESSQ
MKIFTIRDVEESTQTFSCGNTTNVHNWRLFVVGQNLKRIYLLNNTKIHIKDRNVLISKINIKEKLSEVLQIDIVQEIIEIDPTYIENPEHQKFIKNIVGTVITRLRYGIQMNLILTNK